VCPVCGAPRPSESLCPSCASHTMSISSIRSVFRLEGAIRRAIHELKYNNLRAIAPTLSAYLTRYVAGTDCKADLIIPVPLHSSRRRHRGYNQSELLATALARDTGIPLNSNALRRTRKTASQVGSHTAHARLLNVEGAFSCNDDVRSRRILLIDDVCTTGATLESCAAALRREGAVDVWGLTVAREI
ncbi:MAG: ComF family protein, partial [Chloroflexota bacterium]